MSFRMPTARLIPVTVIALIAGLALAGPLDPPVGPVSTTFKTLTEVEPRMAINAINTPGDADSQFTISRPGSYYLTDNLSGAASKAGIKITASGVTLDLAGFALTGGGLQGVVVTGTGLRDITISNGSLSGWGGSGVDTFSATHCRIEAIRSSGNGGGGVRAGSQTLVKGCTATLNSGKGISVQNSCIIDGCAVSANLPGGIAALSSCVVTSCVADGNTSGLGIDVFNGSTVTGCTATGNLTGIQTSGDCTISNCSVRANTGIGILAGLGSTVKACTSGNNTGDGIRISTGCYVYGNTCRSNGLAAGDGQGIHATGGANRIEANDSTGADRGIDVDATGNVIVRNTCSGNFTNNWDVVAGNVCLVVQGVTGGAILGSTGGVAPGSTDPNANFTY